ncbi:MAG: nuclear transport factor 2 family protein [Acidimicrobiales bacterium]
MTIDVSSVVQRLLDKDEVIDLVHRYSYCVDHRLYDEVVSMFTEACVVDYGPGVSPPIHGRLALRKMFGHPSSGYLATSHHNANILVTFDDDDHANVRTSVYAWHQRRDLTTPRLSGYYHDTVERGPDGWLIATRQLCVLGVEEWEAAMHPAVDVDRP